MANSTMVGTGFAMEGTGNNWNHSRIFSSLIFCQGFITAMWCMNCSARCLGDRYKWNVNDAFSLNSSGANWGSFTVVLWICHSQVGLPSYNIHRVETLLAQVRCKGPTCWKSLAAFGRECVQLHCEVRNPFFIVGRHQTVLHRNFHGKVLIVRPPKLGIR